MEQWGSFFDQAPTSESGVPVAAMRAALRPNKGFIGANRQPGMTTMLQSPPTPRMDIPQPPEMPKMGEPVNEIGDIAKGIAGMINPEGQGEQKSDGFNDRMSAIDAQLKAMADERAKLAEAVKTAANPNAPTDKPTYSGTGSGSNAAGPEGFNFNVGNIRTSNIGWQGKGQPHNGFETFDTPQSGAAAMFNNLASYVSASPSMTVAGAISKWAPPTENNTNNYISHVAKTAGVDPNAPLAQILADPDAAAKVMRAMAIMEKGQGLHPAFTHELFRSVAGGKPPDKKEAGYAEGGRIRYLRSLVGD